jgi:hypothetical protein
VDFGTVIFIIIIVVAVVGSKIKKAINDEAERANKMAEEMKHRRIGQEGGVGGPSPEPHIGPAIPGGKQNSLQDLLKTLAQQAQVQVRVKEVVAKPPPLSAKAEEAEYSGEGPRNVDLATDYRSTLGRTGQKEVARVVPGTVAGMGKPEYSGEGPQNVDLTEGYRRSVESATAARTQSISEQAGEPASSQPRTKKLKKQRAQEEAAMVEATAIAAMATGEKGGAAAQTAGVSMPPVPAHVSSVAAEAFLEKLQDLSPWQRAVVLQEVMLPPRALRQMGDSGWV